MVYTVLMHSASPKIKKESKRLYHPCGASARSGAYGPVFSQASKSLAIGARNVRSSTRFRRCLRTSGGQLFGGLILTAAIDYPMASTI